MSAIRRGMMRTQSRENPYEGWMFGYRLNTGAEVENENTCITTYYPCDSGGKVIIGAGSSLSVNMGIWTYDSNKEGSFIGWLNRGGGVSNITIPNGHTFIRVTFPIAGLDDAYILDATKDDYIWKGKNVAPLSDWVKWVIRFTSAGTANVTGTNASNFERMIVDGEEVAPTKQLNLSAGYHRVMVLLKNPAILPSSCCQGNYFGNIDIPASVATLGDSAVRGMGNGGFKAYCIFRNPIPASVNLPATITSFPKGYAYFFVPDDSLSLYKATLPYSNYAAQYYPLSEFNPDDFTT